MDEETEFDGAPEDTGILDQQVFEQILELDDGDQEFLHRLIENYYTQVNAAFETLYKSIVNKDLGAVAAIGHSLKGSSASLGLIKMKETSERLKKIGDYRAEVEPNMPMDILMKAASIELDNLKIEFNKVVQLFNYFFE
ncbi:Multistep phosphorelay regulator 1 [Smittium mucronatum]|uniref:Multistep phosphorelay regulator 1 n=1 Tax=Smittium mucronatum TaxID=133383 RepID=A0A1R0H162_9FUNG|nr:Multistep phosphorelay regulator 1 [Smittium mucronatum]